MDQGKWSSRKSKGDGTARDRKDLARASLVSYFCVTIGSILVLRILDKYEVVGLDPLIKSHDDLVRILTFITTLVVCTFTAWGNFWSLFFLAYLQKFAQQVALLLFGISTLESVLELWPFLFQASLQVGATGAIGAIVGSALNKRRGPLNKVFSVSPIMEWVKKADSRPQNFRWFALILGVISAIVSLLSSLVKSFTVGLLFVFGMLLCFPRDVLCQERKWGILVQSDPQGFVIRSDSEKCGSFGPGLNPLTCEFRGIPLGSPIKLDICVSKRDHVRFEYSRVQFGKDKRKVLTKSKIVEAIAAQKGEWSSYSFRDLLFTRIKLNSIELWRLEE